MGWGHIQDRMAPGEQMFLVLPEEEWTQGPSSCDYFCKKQSKDVLHLALLAGKVSLQETAG